VDRRKIWESDRPMVAEFIERHWQSRVVMSRGKVFYPHECDGFIEWRDGSIVGLLTYFVEDGAMELLTLNSTLEGEGIGSALMLMAIDSGRRSEVKKIWLTTTNDNLRAIGFYQRLGFRMVAVNVGVIDEARKVKPEIPELGYKGIPIHDEIVLELIIEPVLH